MLRRQTWMVEPVENQFGELPTHLFRERPNAGHSRMEHGSLKVIYARHADIGRHIQTAVSQGPIDAMGCGIVTGQNCRYGFASGDNQLGCQVSDVVRVL